MGSGFRLAIAMSLKLPPLFHRHIPALPDFAVQLINENDASVTGLAISVHPTLCLCPLNQYCLEHT